MKLIELSDIQRKKLEKMFDLFEDKIYWWTITSRNLFNESTQTMIHWFEFCMMHLFKKLNVTWYNYTRWQAEEGETHVIDYLYKQYQMLKK